MTIARTVPFQGTLYLMQGLLPIIGDWLRSTFQKPSPIQRMAWLEIQGGENCLLLVPTGSGKTLAAFLTVIDRLARLGYAKRFRPTSMQSTSPR